MKISYVTLYDPSDIHKWSGAGYYISKVLENEGAELDYIGKDIKIPVRRINRLKKITYRFINKKFNYQRTLKFAGLFAEKASPLIKADTDIIFSPGSIAISQIKSSKPKVFYTDATFASIINFYESYTRLPHEIIEQGNMIDQQALDSCRLAIYSSDWAAQGAIKNYNVNPEKVKVVPFGANVDTQHNLKTIKTMVAQRSRNVCNLLFVGVDWKRKGGDMAVKVATKLNNDGLKTNLHVVGIKNMHKNSLPPFVINHGFISKATSEGRDKINALFSQSHFLILPTRAEAFGLVFAEASAFGLPSLATNIGGIPTAIHNGRNGYTFAPEDSETTYAEYIHNCFNNQDFYKQLALSSFNEYDQRLNWRTAGESLMKLLKSI